MELRLPTVSSGKPEKEPEKEPCDAAGETSAAGDAWARVLADLSHDIDPTAYASWVLDLNFVGIVDGAAVIEAETAFKADWVRSRYADVIRCACARHFGSDRITIRARLSRTAAPDDIDAGALKRARCESTRPEE